MACGGGIAIGPQLRGRCGEPLRNGGFDPTRSTRALGNRSDGRRRDAQVAGNLGQRSASQPQAHLDLFVLFSRALQASKLVGSSVTHYRQL